MNKRIVITGALGHIGSKFIHEVEPGQFDEVILVDNLFTQRYPSLFNLPQGVNFHFLEKDILKADLVQIFNKVDVVIHLAAITNAAGSFDIQDEVERVNFVGTQLVAEACAKTGTRLIFLSTTSVYGTQAELVDESCSIDQLQPQSPYAKSKLAAENYLTELAKSSGLQFIALRFGTIFGSSVGMRFHTAVNKFLWQAVQQEPISVWKTAYHQKRPYLDLSDAVRALNFIIAGNIFTNEVYNVLTNNYTVEDIVSSIRKFIPAVDVEFVDAAIMNQLSYEVSCEKFKRLGFEFRGDINSFLADSIALLKNMNSGNTINVTG